VLLTGDHVHGRARLRTDVLSVRKTKLADCDWIARGSTVAVELV
jgi:hypothetical protein